jgi:hypothetical protein
MLRMTTSLRLGRAELLAQAGSTSSWFDIKLIPWKIQVLLPALAKEVC